MISDVNIMTPTVVAAPISELGEGPCWDERTQELYWVDIEGARIHRLCPATGATESYVAPEKISALIPCEDGGWIAAAYHSLYYWGGAGSEFVECLHLDLPAHVRFNDGKAGPDGALWIGTLNMTGPEKVGHLYRIDGQLQAEIKVDQVLCSNGLDWNADYTEMYYIDSGSPEVRAYQFDVASGSLGACRTAIQLGDTGGVPDGMSIDQEGMLWVAEWGGSRVACWNPDNGQMLGTIPMPVLQPSSCAFGGESYDKLFITTAAEGLDDSQRKAAPTTGSLFQIEDGLGGVRGRAPFKFVRG